MKPIPKRFFLLSIFIVLSFPEALYGDIVHLKNGGSIEGKIEKEDETFIEIKTQYGSVKITRDRILKLEYALSPEEAYEQKIRSLDRNNPDSLFDLALWCKENGKQRDYKRYLMDTLRLNPEHEGANLEMGKTLYKGKWFTKEELERFREKETEEMKAKGLILYLGEWMTPEEKKKRDGFMEWEGVLVPGIEYYHKVAERDLPEYFEETALITDSEHFSVRSLGKTDLHADVLATSELAFDHFIRTFRPDEFAMNRLSRYPIPIYFMPDKETCLQFVNSGYQRRYVTVQDKVLRYGPVTSFSYAFPKPFILILENPDPTDPRDIATIEMGYLTHHLGHILLQRYLGSMAVPAWVESGISHYYEGLGNYFQTLSVFRYNDKKDVKYPWTPGWDNYLEWRKNVIDPDFHDGLPSIEDLLLVEDLDSLDSKGMAKAWSATAFMLEKHRDAFIRYMQTASSIESTIKSDNAWTQAIPDLSPSQAEEEWRRWVQDQPIGPSRKERLGWKG